METLGQIPTLECLDLRHSKVTAAGLERLKSLARLDTFYGDNLDDRCLQSLGRHVNLRRLYAYGKFSEAGIAGLGSLTKLEWLFLPAGTLDDRCLNHLNRLTRLTCLAGLGKVSDAGLVNLKDMTRLNALHVRDGNITDAGLKSLRGMEGLQTLDLSGTRITDRGMEDLGGLRNLETLDLSRTAVGDAGLGHLSKLPRLRRLFLASSKVTDAGAAEISKLRGRTLAPGRDEDRRPGIEGIVAHGMARGTRFGGDGRQR